MSWNRSIVTLSSVCVFVFSLPVLGSAADVKVPKRIDYASKTRVRAAIRDQCKLQTVVPEAVASAASAQLVDGRGNLSMEITNAHGPGGWVFSGPKWLEVSGKLSQGGRTYSFRAKRYSAVDPFGGVCTILQKCARALGEDVADWLANPVDGAEIGDAR